MNETTPAWTHVFPRGALASATLTFESGVAPRLDVRGAPLGETLARCRLPDPAPRVGFARDELSIDYHGFFRWFFLGRYPPGLVELNDAVAWRVGVEGGLAKVGFDLQTVRLRAFEVRGGAAKLDLRLGRPEGIVPIHLTGGAARLRITHPPGVGARLRVTGGATSVAFDRQTLRAVGGGLTLTSRGWDETGDGYDVKIGGGVAGLTVEAEGSE